MRYALLLLLVPAAMSAGCSLYIANAGVDLGGLETRADVHKQFGEPVATGTEEELTYEEFRSRRKYADRYYSHGDGYAIFFLGTGGLIELYAFPRQLYLLGKRTLFGQPIRAYYDTDGKLHHVTVDGDSVWLDRRYTPTSPEADAAAEKK